MKKRTDQFVITGIKPPLRRAIKKRAEQQRRSASYVARESLETDFLKSK